MALTITAAISTKDRYFTTLPVAIFSVLQQTVKINHFILFDDGEHRDLRKESIYNNLFAMMQNNGIGWEVIFGNRIGQVANHQRTIEMAKTDLIWRVDDDNSYELDALEHLVRAIEPDDVGIVGGRIQFPTQSIMPHRLCSGRIEDLFSKGNLQWSDFPHTTDVDHLTNTFLYKRNAAKHGYCMELSPVGHGEETLFTYGFKRAGYRVLMEPTAHALHMREPTGGIRSYSDIALWDNDTKITARILNEWGINFKNYKLIVLDCGLGDHCSFKMILPEIKEKFGDRKIQIACCYPDLFKNEKDVEIISIAEAYTIDSDKDKYNIYKWMWDRNWTGKLTDAYRGMYL